VLHSFFSLPSRRYSPNQNPGVGGGVRIAMSKHLWPDNGNDKLQPIVVLDRMVCSQGSPHRVCDMPWSMDKVMAGSSPGPGVASQPVVFLGFPVFYMAGARGSPLHIYPRQLR
jgi:hypothetical protein